MQRLVRNIPTAAALIVGAASFILSFVALKEVAASVGAVPDSLAWLVPIVVDGGVLAGSASLWASSYHQTRRDPVAYLTVATLLAFSVLINVHHAGDTLIAKAIAALPPIVLLACLELVAAGHRRAIGTPNLGIGDLSGSRVPDLPVATLYTTAPQPGHIPARQAPRTVEGTWEGTLDDRSEYIHHAAGQEDDPGSVRHSQPPGGSSASKAEQIRTLYDDYILAGRDPRDPELPKAIAENLGVAPSYVRRLLKPARGARVRAEAPMSAPRA